ncbi:MAG: DNA repair protein RecN [Pseudomonadota bacterium]
MLVELHIRHFAIIDELHLELGPGLTVMTGETGAGKSILVDALGLIAGGRADAGMIRHGAERAEITASFAIAAQSAVAAWLEHHDIAAEDGECVARRVITATGRSQAYLGASRVPAATLGSFCEQLLNIHGQQANQGLLQRATQRRALDMLGKLSTPAAQLRTRWERWRQARAALDDLLAQQETLSQADLELLHHQVQELEALAVQDGEVESLEAELRVLGSAGEVIQNAELALAALSAEPSGANEALAKASRELKAGASVDPRLGDIAQVLDEAQIQLTEAIGSLERYLTDIDADPERLAAVEQRLGSIDDIARKHRARSSELGEVLDRLSTRLAASQDMEGTLRDAEERLGGADRAYRKAARTLHEARRKASRKVQQTAQGIIRSLGLGNATFQIGVHHQEDGTPTSHGLDDVTFGISTNPGQPPGPLDKVASGGELSRIALALEVLAAESSVVPCLVFDEVDTGVGGGVAEIVGRCLRQLGASHQVLCVTHLPQVASQAHHHLRVTKQVKSGHTNTRLEALEHDDAINELARMLGGVEITATTRAHAREMREQAQEGI